jgi:hypothetical protein
MGPAFLRKYATGSGADVYVEVTKAGVKDFAVGGDWTPAAGDVKVSKDGGAQANIATLPTYANGSWKFVFSNGELTCKKLSVRVVDSATKAVEDFAFEIETFGHASALYQFDPTNGNNLGASYIDQSSSSVPLGGGAAYKLNLVRSGVTKALKQFPSQALADSAKIAVDALISGLGSNAHAFVTYEGKRLQVGDTTTVTAV